VAAANRGEKGVSWLFLVEKMARDFSANHKAERLKNITVSSKIEKRLPVAENQV